MTAQFGVTVRVVSRCTIAVSSPGNSTAAREPVGADAAVNLNCTKGFKALIRAGDQGIAAVQTSTGENDLVSYTISDMTSSGTDSNVLTINF